jgi:hypothetical protein
MEKQRRGKCLVLTGRVFIGRNDNARVGDLAVRPYDDDYTRNVSRPNDKFSQGYSGFVVADVFDGEKWEWFELRGVLPWKEVSFSMRKHADGRVLHAAGVLSHFKGRHGYPVLHGRFPRNVYILEIGPCPAA